MAAVGHTPGRQPLAPECPPTQRGMLGTAPQPSALAFLQPLSERLRQPHPSKMSHPVSNATPPLKPNTVNLTMDEAQDLVVRALTAAGALPELSLIHI